jgi:hypothetical protein
LSQQSAHRQKLIGLMKGFPKIKPATFSGKPTNAE